MKKILSGLAAFAAVAAVFSGCSGVQKVINTGDAELIYDRALIYYNAEKWNKAAALFESCEQLLAGTLKEDSVAFFIARCKFKEHDFGTSSAMLDEFRRKFGRSVFLEDAEGMYAISLYNMCPEPSRDQSITSQAIIAITEFMSHYPDSEQYPLFKDMIDDLTWRLHEKAYINAYTYYKIERYNSAIIAFRNALKQYPDTHRREDLLYHIVLASYKLASNSVEDKQMDRYMSALDAYYSFIMEFPESEYAKQLDHVAEQCKRFIEKNRKEE